MLRLVAAWTAAVLGGAILGAASAWGALELGRTGLSEHYGAWSYNRAAGSAAADPYSRAIIAREGLLALSSVEALYYYLERDEDGRPLDESCVYELAGAPLAARWWSVTLYARDGFLVDNNDHAASVDASRIRPGANWRVRVAPVRGDTAYWLSSRSAQRGFSLMLRVYNPQRDFLPSADTLPLLTTVSCAGRSNG